MDLNTNISALVQYGLEKELFQPCDKAFIINQLISLLKLDTFTPEQIHPKPLEEILQGLVDGAVARGIIPGDSTSRDLFDTALMGAMTPPPREVRARFAGLYAEDPKAATDWFYKFSQDTDYIRRYRIVKDVRWKTATEYGSLDISINLSKPEKDPKAIAAAKAAPQSGYPKCQLCAENEAMQAVSTIPPGRITGSSPLTSAGRTGISSTVPMSTIMSIASPSIPSIRP